MVGSQATFFRIFDFDQSGDLSFEESAALALALQVPLRDDRLPPLSNWGARLFFLSNLPTLLIRPKLSLSFSRRGLWEKERERESRAERDVRVTFGVLRQERDRSLAKNDETWDDLGVLASVVVLYILLSTLYFAHSEPWGYLESLYFVLISLTTVGLGDRVPDFRNQFLPKRAPGVRVFFKTEMPQIRIIFSSHTRALSLSLSKERRGKEPSRDSYINSSDYDIGKHGIWRSTSLWSSAWASWARSSQPSPHSASPPPRSSPRKKPNTPPVRRIARLVPPLSQTRTPPPRIPTCRNR